MRISEKTKEKALSGLLSADIDADLYGSLAVLNIIYGKNVPRALEKIKYSAEWFEHPHLLGNPQNGECDFVAVRLIPLLFDARGFERLTDEVKNAVRRFYLERDFKSVYGSENHIIMFRVARLLAAQFYKDGYFAAYDMTSDAIRAADTEFIKEFIDYRASHGFGEFDSLGYIAEDLLVFNTLYAYTDNAELKRKAGMIMDIIFLDMIADSNGRIYGGAHGRSYPNQVMNAYDSETARLYAYYFGYESECPNAITLLSDYEPSEAVYEIAENKKYPYENRERKHLHCWSVWVSEINREELKKPYGSINKYTYLCDDYIIGAVNMQGKYPEHSPDKDYAYHQQHNFELTLLGNPTHKIFTHHPGNSGAHNYWTGDACCRCSAQYTNKNTAVVMYNIEEPRESRFIHAYLPKDAFKNRISDGKYLFLEYGRLYISLYFSEGHRSKAHSDFEELISDGSQHAFVLRVEYKEKYASLADFGESIKRIPVIFDKEAKTVEFDGIEVRRDGNSEGGVENAYPYENTYDCYFMRSRWGSGVIEVISEDKTLIYDFYRNEIRTEKRCGEII